MSGGARHRRKSRVRVGVVVAAAAGVVVVVEVEAAGRLRVVARVVVAGTRRRRVRRTPRDRHWRLVSLIAAAVAAAVSATFVVAGQTVTEPGQGGGRGRGRYEIVELCAVAGRLGVELDRGEPVDQPLVLQQAVLVLGSQIVILQRTHTHAHTFTQTQRNEPRTNRIEKVVD